MPPNVCFYSVVLLTLVVSSCILVSSQKHKPDYNILTIENSDLCSLVKTRTIRLGKREKSALMVKQFRLNDHSTPWMRNSVCTFKVTYTHSFLPAKLFDFGPSYETGILAVIQDLVFRKNESTNECIDYVQFKLHNGQMSQKFCGLLNTGFSMDHRFQDSALYDALGMGAAKSKKDMDVVIFISKEPLQEDENMDLKIVFTAYTDCTEDKDPRMKPCSRYHQKTCIYENFFNDTIVNCPYVDCVDEGGCADENFTILDEVPPYYGTKVLVGSVSFLFVLFGCFVCFIWLCKKHKVLCWADEFAHPNRTSGAPTRVMEMSEQPGVVAGSGVPTAPPPEEDKPPSYESLFPSR